MQSSQTNLQFSFVFKTIFIVLLISVFLIYLKSPLKQWDITVYRLSIFLHVIVLSVILPTFLAYHCLAASTPAELSLNDAIEIAHQAAHSKTTSSRLEIESAEQEVKEIFGTFYSPRFDLESYTGLVSDARGDITTTTDTNEDYGGLGPFLKIDLKVIQPIYSFGKYASAKEAGQNNLVMKKAMFRESKDDLTLEVTKAFLGVVAGRAGKEVSNELRKRYEQLITQVEKNLKTPDSNLDDADLLEARSLHFQIEKLCSSISANTDQSLLYLKGLLNLDPDMPLTALATKTPEIAQSPSITPQLQKYFREHSPLLQGLHSGMNALQKKAELEERKRYPDLFLALGAGYGTAQNRDKQENAFVTDYYNYEKFGGVLGLKWNFNFHVSEAKIEKAFIEYKQLSEKKELTLRLKDGAIAKLYGDAVRNKGLLAAADKSLKSATGWLRLESDNVDLGLGDIKRLIKAYQYYFQLKGDVISTRYMYLLSLAELANTTGDMNLLLQWIDNGKVQI